MPLPPGFQVKQPNLPQGFQLKAKTEESAGLTVPQQTGQNMLRTSQNLETDPRFQRTTTQTRPAGPVDDPVLFSGGRENAESVGTVTREQPRPSVIDQNQQERNTSVGQNVVGIGDAGVTVGRGIPSMIGGGIVGLGKLILDAARGDQDALNNAVRISEQIVSKGTGQPFTEAGEDALQMFSEPLQMAEELTKGAGNAVLDATGSPALATATQVGLESLPVAPATMRGSTRAVQRSQDIRQVQNDADRVGLDLEADPVQRTEQLVDSASDRVGQSTSGENIETVRDSVSSLRETENQRVNDLYSLARQEGQGVDVRDSAVVDIFSRSSDVLREQGFPLEDMPRVQSRLNALDNILERGEDVPLNELETWRKTLNRRIPQDPESNRALGVVRQQYDQVMDDLFNSDMISGDPQAISRWRDARQARSDFIRRFETDRTIQNLQREDATPREIKNWILGANAANAPGPSVRVVSKIKDMFGEDSPEMGAIRSEMAFDIVEPLLGETPDFNRFIRNYDQMMKKNDRLAREVFGEEVLGDIDKIRRFSGSIRDKTTSGLGLDPTTIAVRMMFGNQLAKNQAKLRAVTSILKSSARRLFSGSEKDQIISGVLGYDINQPVFSFNRTAAPLATIQTGMNEEDQ